MVNPSTDPETESPVADVAAASSSVSSRHSNEAPAKKAEGKFASKKERAADPAAEGGAKPENQADAKIFNCSSCRRRAGSGASLAKRK